VAKDELLEISGERKAKLARLALSEENYREIVRRLRREPSDLVLAIFAALWSEHCSYAHSKPLLQKYFGQLRMPPWAIAEANAGAINIDAAVRFDREKGE